MTELPIEGIKRWTPSLSTGSTLLNLALTDSIDGGFLPGKYFYLVGDSRSGKTFISMTCFAEAVRNTHFANYRLIYDNIEDGMLMDVDRLFGGMVEERVETPGKTEDAHSATIEEFYYHLDDAISQDRPFVYVLDSMDGLSSESEGKKFQDQKKAHRGGRKVPGSYGDGKARYNSAAIRRALKGIRSSGSILIIISQTRDSLDASPWGPRKTRSGGRALRFYATAELWTSIVGSIHKTVRGKKRRIGENVRVKLEKNRITGKRHSIEIPIYPSYGMDDIGSCIDYLVSEGWWKKSRGTITIPDEGKFTRNLLIERFSTDISELQHHVGMCWNSIRKESSLGRGFRYE